MRNEELTIYRPNARHELGLFKTWAVMFRNIYESRELITQVFKRNFFGQYRKSFLGVAWFAVSPIVGVLSWVMLQAAGILTAGDPGVPYPVFVFVGAAMWGLFSGMVMASSKTLSSGADLVLQVKYPHEALLVEQAAAQLAAFAVSLVLSLVAVLVVGVVPAWQIVFLPLVLAPMILLASGLGLFASMISAITVEASEVLRVGLGLLMFSLPIVYATSEVSHPLLLQLNYYNPFTHLVCSARDLVLFGRLYDLPGFAASSALALVVFLASWRAFFVSESRVIERML